MCFSNDNLTYTDWEPYATSKQWVLHEEPGTKTVYVRFMDYSGLVSTSSDTIILDTTSPSGSISINDGEDFTSSISVELILSAVDETSNVFQMCFSNDNLTYTDWEPYATSKSWTLTTLDGLKTVYVRFMDYSGLVSTSSDTIILDTTPPIAEAGSNQTVDEDVLVVLDGSASWDNNGISSYVWSFMDGSPVVLWGQSVNYTFSMPGVYEVSLNVSDSSGKEAMDSVLVTVLDVSPPVADAGVDRVVDEDVLVVLDGSASWDNVGITSYVWTFIDGTQQTLFGESVLYNFTNPGIYDIMLYVSDSANNNHQTSIKIKVEDVTPPVADAGVDRVVDEDVLVVLDGSASWDNVGITSYVWTFIDGSLKTITGPITNYTFSDPNLYLITLNVSDSEGNSNTHELIITVKDITPPIADAGQDQVVQKNIETIFSALESKDNGKIASYLWDFGDGNTTDGAFVSHEYSETGTYLVTLTVTDSDGNNDITTINITVVGSRFPWMMLGIGVVIVTMISVISIIMIRRRLGKLSADRLSTS
jgi:PKD repeat protein